MSVKKLNTHNTIYVLDTDKLKTLEDVIIFLKTLHVAVPVERFHQVPDVVKGFFKEKTIEEYQKHNY